MHTTATDDHNVYGYRGVVSAITELDSAPIPLVAQVHDTNMITLHDRFSQLEINLVQSNQDSLLVQAPTISERLRAIHDSGASICIFRFRHLFTDFRPLKFKYVQLDKLYSQMELVQ